MKEYHISKKYKRDWQKNILDWYDLNARSLPWRKLKSQNFYRIWISEIMLQQTMVKTVIPYYEKFLKKWPSLDYFYEATLEEILLIWQGLGYYQRAKNLYLAKEILRKKKLIEINIENLMNLPGIGEYVASAICAILKDENCAVIDGNIKRILSRAFELNKNEKLYKKKVVYIATQLTPLINNKNYCQSLMDLANKVCLPKNPDCSVCPVDSLCLSSGKVAQQKTNNQEKVKKFGLIFIVKYKDFFLIEKTKDKLLENLYCFPLTDFTEFTNSNTYEIKIKDIASKWLTNNGLDNAFIINKSINHAFSHFRLNLFIIELKLKNKRNFKKYEWIRKKDLKNKPISKLMSKVIKEVI